MHQPDVVIRGAGVIGRSLALELRSRGKRVLLLHKEHSGTASLAAAGMLAAHDPHNPPALQPLADLALVLYPNFLVRVRDLSGHAVSIHTRYVLEPHSQGVSGHTLLPAVSPDAGNFILREEESLDPREITAALAAACRAAGVIEEVLPLDTVDPFISIEAGQLHRPAQRRNLHFAPAHTAAVYVDCTGAWSGHARPAKGQMLRVRLPADTLRLRSGSNAVLRTEDIYLVPRLDGTTLIGATVEDRGFDLTVDLAALAELRAKAAVLVPAAATATEVESWSGLRPRTRDDLPALGELAEEVCVCPTSGFSDVGQGAAARFIANGLFRNGILLAPAVAHVMSQLLCGERPAVDLAPFSPLRPALTVIAQTR